MAIMNMGPKMRLRGPDLAFERQLDDDPSQLFAGLRPDAELATLEYDLPLMFRMGLAIDLVGGISTFMANEMNRLTAHVDIEDPNDQVARLAFSAEYAWNETVYLRGGYRLQGKVSEQLGARLQGQPRELMEFGYGAGVRTTLAGYAIQFDFGMADYGDLGSVTQFFFSLGF